MPKSGSAAEPDRVSDVVRLNLAVNLRNARLARGLSMRELALTTGLSKALVSQLERSVANPTLEVIGKLCEALDLRFAELTRCPVAGPEVVRSGEGPVIRSGKVSIRSLFRSTDRSWSELAEASLPAASKTTSASHRDGSVEFAYVVKGSVQIHTGDWSESLQMGDAIRFDGTTEHWYAAGDQGALLLTSVSEPDL